MNKLKEGFVSSFQYNPPADPEKLLYDFYFLVGYASPGKFSREEDQYAIAKVIEDCVDHLQKHMISALKFALAAEFRHYRSASELSSHDVFKKELAKMSPEMQKFIFKYERELTYLQKSEDIAILDPRVRSVNKQLAQDPFLKGEQENPGGSSRTSHYVIAYRAILAAQKSTNTSEYELSLIFSYIFDKMRWHGGYGGKAWANIADAYRKLRASTTLQDKIIWIDHAYDLQHNTDTVFNKLKTLYSKEGSFTWIARALDWKRDQTDLRKFYYKVSEGLRPLVGFVAYRSGVFIEDIKDEDETKPAVARKSPSSPSSSSPPSKKGFFEVGKYYKCLLSERGPLWNPDGLMDGMLDGKPHKCIAAGYPNYALFEGIPPNSGNSEGFWAWEPSEIKEVSSSGTSSSSEFFVGDFVKVKDKDVTPAYGWGDVDPDEVGQITTIYPASKKAYVDFPSQKNWAAVLSELEKVENHQPGAASRRTKGFKDGDKVKIKVDHPKYGWGGVKKDSIGTVTKVSLYLVDVDFPEQTLVVDPRDLEKV